MGPQLVPHYAERHQPLGQLMGIYPVWKNTKIYLLKIYLYIWRTCVIK